MTEPIQQNSETNSRSEFSDYVIKKAKKYFKESKIPAELSSEMHSQNLMIVPFGSILRGNANELTADLDLFLITQGNPDIIRSSMNDLVNGKFNNDISLGQYITDNKEFEVDAHSVSVVDLLNSIPAGNLTSKADYGGGHSNSVILGTILRVNEDYLIYQASDHTLGNIRTQAEHSLVDNEEAEDLIFEDYNHFLNWKKED